MHAICNLASQQRMRGRHGGSARSHGENKTPAQRQWPAARGRRRHVERPFTAARSAASASPRALRSPTKGNWRNALETPRERPQALWGIKARRDQDVTRYKHV